MSRKTASASTKAKGFKSRGSGIRRGRSIMKSKRSSSMSAARINLRKAEFKEVVASRNKPSIPFIAFGRLCVEILQCLPHKHEPLSFQQDAIRALYEASADFCSSVMQGVRLIAGHAGRKTIMKKDFQVLYGVIGTIPSPANKALRSMLHRGSKDEE
ncbi:hypothetical protein ACHAP5_008313 [Fusarium lateritium]